jgi:RNA-directed DNA polymerase
VVSSEVFASLDNHVWRLIYKWARHTHPNKPRGWVTARYFGRFNTSRQDRWVFGDRETGRYLTKFSWTKIVRHQLVPKGASVDDPALTEYWASRRRRNTPPLSPFWLRLLHQQHGRCPACGSLLLHDDHEPQSPHEWEQWLRATRTAVRKNTTTADRGGGKPDDLVAFQLIHVHCHRWRGSEGKRKPAALAADGPSRPA